MQYKFRHKWDEYSTALTVCLLCVSCPHHWLIRYNSGAHTSDFAADGSNSTYWESDSGQESATISLGFNSTVSLSKVFVHFQSPLPSKATLQFLRDGETSWEDLQFFADDCSTQFGMENNAE